MITPNSNKGSFGTYFKFRLRSQLGYMIVSFVLNIFMLPLFAVNVFVTVKNKYEHSATPTFSFTTLTSGFQTVSGIILFLITVFSATKVFDYCVKSERTDTFGGLPVTLRGRFFADLLSGFTSRVAPMIPCAVFAMIMSVPIQNIFVKMQPDALDGIMIKVFAELIITLLITYTFAYLLSVIITVCCGKTSSSVTYTILVSTGLMAASFAMIGYFTECQLGAGYFGDAIITLRFIPPIGTFVKAYSVFTEIGVFYFENTDLDLIYPLPIIVYIILGAAIVALAYFIFRTRKPENTGHTLAVGHFYHVFAGMVAFSLVCFCFSAMYQFHTRWLSALVAAVIAVITLIIFTVSNKAERRHVKNNIFRITSVTAGCIAFLFIIDKTGAFGTRYYNYSAEKTKSINITIYDDYYMFDPHTESLVIDNKEDIEQFISAANKTLKTRSEELERSGEFSVTYTLENGREVKRTYGIRRIFNLTEYPNAIEEMFENVYALPNYSKYISEKAYERLNSEKEKVIYAVMYDKFGKVFITEDQVKEFSDIFSREMLEKYDKDAERIGKVYCTANQDGHGYTENSEFPVLECYTDTAAYIESLRQHNGEEEAFKIITYNGVYFDMTVRLKDADDAPEKELFSLFERETKEHYYTRESSGGKIVFSIRSSNEGNYYIPDEDTQHALELIMTIIKKQFAQKSS